MAIKSVELAAPKNARLTKATIKLLKRNREELFGSSEIEEILKIMPIIPKGRYVGDMPAHMCHGNSLEVRNTKGTEVYIGYIVSAPNTFFTHSFNVKEGKVEEHTKLKHYDKYTYIGVPVPPRFKKLTAAYTKTKESLAWVQQQIGTMT